MGTSAAGTVINGKVPFVCQYFQHNMVSSKGTIWHRNYHFDVDYSTLFLAQITFIVLVARTIYPLLKPLRQDMVAPQVLAGIIIGPTVLGRYMGPQMQKLYPMSNKVALHTAAYMGYIFHIFVIGVKKDTSILKKAERRAMIIGVVLFFMPSAFGGLTFLILNRLMTLDLALTTFLPNVVLANSITSFAVITNLLADLKILNSDIGRLATSISMITDLCGGFTSITLVALGAARESKWIAFWSLLGIVVFFITTVFVFRPFMLWLTKHTPKGQPMKEIHFFVIVVLVLSSSIGSQIIGQNSALGPFILGLAIPDGPPLGSNLVRKIDPIATGLLLPIFVAIGGMETDFFSAVAQGKSLLVIELVIIMGYVGRFSGTFLPALYCKVPFWEAVTLALIMCSKGIVDVAVYISYLKEFQFIDDRSFSLLLMTMLIVTGVSRPLIERLYDPSKRYMTHGRRTILHSKDENQLKILVCVYHEDNVPPILNLLEASNFSFFTPASIFVLRLMELTGRASAIFAPHDDDDHDDDHLHHHHHHIINAFSNFEQQHQESLMLKHFIAVAPYVSMHDDICSLAEEKRTAIVIVPYHKKFWAIDGTTVGSNTIPAIRTVNLNVINKAPCSVGILIDLGDQRQTVGNHQYSPYRIGLLFFGGADDREALAYSRRMAKHPHVKLTVIRFIHENHDDVIQENETNILDNRFIDEFKTNNAGVFSGSNHYREKIVKDGSETTRAIRSMRDDFDLVIVGRYHHPNSPLTLGLSTDTEWSECPELGVIGDMLVTSDSQFSLLVVQQQPQPVLLNTPK